MLKNRGVEDDPFPTEDRWIKCFIARPQKIFNDTILGRCIIDSCFGVEPDEAICRSVIGLPREHEVWPKLNVQCLIWLNEWRKWSVEKRNAYGINAYVGTIIDVISLAGRLNLVDVITDFKDNHTAWLRWAADLRLGTSHDPYWTIAATIALNQTEQDGDRFAKIWFELIRHANHRDDWNDARNGLAALRHIPPLYHEPTLWIFGVIEFIKILPDTNEANAVFVRIWREEVMLFESQIREKLADAVSVYIRFMSAEKRWGQLRAVLN